MMRSIAGGSGRKFANEVRQLARVGALISMPDRQSKANKSVDEQCPISPVSRMLPSEVIKEALRQRSRPAL